MASGSGWASVLRFFEPYLAWHETIDLPEVCVDMANEWYEWHTYKKMIFDQESIAYAFVGCNADWVLAHPDFGFILRRLDDEAMEIFGTWEPAGASDSDGSYF